MFFSRSHLVIVAAIVTEWKQGKRRITARVSYQGVIEPIEDEIDVDACDPREGHNEAVKGVCAQQPDEIRLDLSSLRASDRDKYLIRRSWHAVGVPIIEASLKEPKSGAKIERALKRVLRLIEHAALGALLLSEVYHICAR